VLVIFATIYEIYLQVNGYDIKTTRKYFNPTGDTDEQPSQCVVKEADSVQMKISKNSIGLTNGNVLKFNIPVDREAPAQTLKATCKYALVRSCLPNFEDFVLLAQVFPLS
jgi:hypothetical protein